MHWIATLIGFFCIQNTDWKWSENNTVFVETLSGKSHVNRVKLTVELN